MILPHSKQIASLVFTQAFLVFSLCCCPSLTGPDVGGGRKLPLSSYVWPRETTVVPFSVLKVKTSLIVLVYHKKRACVPKESIWRLRRSLIHFSVIQRVPSWAAMFLLAPKRCMRLQCSALRQGGRAWRQGAWLFHLLHFADRSVLDTMVYYLERRWYSVQDASLEAVSETSFGEADHLWLLVFGARPLPSTGH